MKTLKVKLTFLEDCLGTASNNKNLHSDYIASKAPNAKSKAEEIGDEIILVNRKKWHL